MKFERHHEILKRLSKFGSVKVSDLSNSLNVTKETIRSDLNELAVLGYLTRCHGGAFIVLDSLDTIAKMKSLMRLKIMIQPRIKKATNYEKSSMRYWFV